MAALIVDRRGARISLSSKGVLRVQYDNGETHRAGLSAFRQLVLLGEVELSTGVLRACQAAGVGVVLLPRRGRTEALHLLPGAATGTMLRHAQHIVYGNPQVRLHLARRLVQAKIEQQALWLDAHGRAPDLTRFHAATDAASDFDQLRGVEGAASARYFEHWARHWRQPWAFSGRNRRPPRDPVNALLSLSYALALSHVGRLIGLKGLDPAVGFLHGPQRERPALALDLLEPLRPRIDQWVWRILHDDGALTPDHFTHGRTEGCRLDKDGRTIYFSKWYRSEREWLRIPSRNALALVVHALRHHLPGRCTEQTEAAMPERLD